MNTTIISSNYWKHLSQVFVSLAEKYSYEPLKPLLDLLLSATFSSALTVHSRLFLVISDTFTNIKSQWNWKEWSSLLCKLRQLTKKVCRIYVITVFSDYQGLSSKVFWPCVLDEVIWHYVAFFISCWTFSKAAGKAMLQVFVYYHRVFVWHKSEMAVYFCKSSKCLPFLK